MLCVAAAPGALVGVVVVALIAAVPRALRVPVHAGLTTVDGDRAVLAESACWRRLLSWCCCSARLGLLQGRLEFLDLVFELVHVCSG